MFSQSFKLINKYVIFGKVVINNVNGIYLREQLCRALLLINVLGYILRNERLSWEIFPRASQ